MSSTRRLNRLRGRIWLEKQKDRLLTQSARTTNDLKINGDSEPAGGERLFSCCERMPDLWLKIGNLRTFALQFTGRSIPFI